MNQIVNYAWNAWKGYIEKDLFMYVICLAIFNHILHFVIYVISNFQITFTKLIFIFLC
jgi:hypothetical protein